MSEREHQPESEDDNSPVRDSTSVNVSAHFSPVSVLISIDSVSKMTQKAISGRI
jgi:hypothetical protein